MTAEFLWNLFLRTGLPEAYLLYNRTISNVSHDSFGEAHGETVQISSETHML